MLLFSADAKIFRKEIKTIFYPKKDEKVTSKSCTLMAVGRFFFSAAPTAQNSPELQFHFINSFIQLSLLGSLFNHALNSRAELHQISALVFRKI